MALTKQNGTWVYNYLAMQNSSFFLFNKYFCEFFCELLKVMPNFL